MDWNVIQNFSSNIVFGILLFSVIIYWTSLFLPTWSNTMTKIGKVSATVANIMLFFILASRWIISGYFPLSNLYESLLFLTWTLLTIYLYIEFKTKSKLIGATLIPVTLLINGFANLKLPLEMQKASPLVPALQSNWLMMHVSMMMVSYATLIIGSLLSILYLAFNFFASKKKTTSTTVNSMSLDSTIIASVDYSKLSLLQTVDTWSYRIIGLGFPFLTIGIISGAVWANEAWGSYWSWDPKETWALITWLVFAIYLHSRLLKGWQGEKAALVGSVGFFVIWICYLGVNFLGKGLHSYGWVLN